MEYELSSPKKMITSDNNSPANFDLTTIFIRLVCLNIKKKGEEKPHLLFYSIRILLIKINF